MSEDEAKLPFNDGMIGVVRRIMTINLRSNSEEQRENIFHTRCGIKRKTCSMIVIVMLCGEFILCGKTGTCMHETPYSL